MNTQFWIKNIREKTDEELQTMNAILYKLKDWDVLYQKYKRKSLDDLHYIIILEIQRRKENETFK